MALFTPATAVYFGRRGGRVRSARKTAANRLKATYPRPTRYKVPDDYLRITRRWGNPTWSCWYREMIRLQAERHEIRTVEDLSRLLRRYA